MAGEAYTYMKAKTIGDLLTILQKLKETGYDMSADWNGYDDYSLNIHPNDGNWVSIDPDPYETGDS